MKNIRNIIITIISLLILVSIITIVSLAKFSKREVISQKVTNSLNNIAIMVYDSSEQDYVEQANVPIGNYLLNVQRTACIAGGSILNYDSSTGKITYLLNGNDKCFIYFDLAGQQLSSQITNLIGTEETNAEGIWMVVNDHGIRYAGANPDNYIDIGDAFQTDMYDAYINEVGMYASELGIPGLPVTTPAECSSVLSGYTELLTQENLTATCQKSHSAGDPILWRIIGIFEEQYDSNDDNIPDTTGNLIKIIRDAPLGAYIFDYKKRNVGSSNGAEGSNDWSDSQLMMMLNPPEFYKSGYDASGNLVHSDYTITTGNNTNSIYDSNSILIYKNMGAYWNANMTAYVPAETTTSGFDSEDTVSLPTLPASIQNKVKTVKWHLGGISITNLTQQALASDLYTAERGTNIYTGRPVYWYGKVGLIYPSDYAYATYGGSTYNRTACLALKPYEWENDDYEDCHDNDWLYSMSPRWALTPIQDGPTMQMITADNTSAGVASNYIAVKPVIYLAQSTQISGGNGTIANPYVVQ